MAEYEVLEEDLRSYQDGQTVELEIRDRETLEAMPVRAVIFRKPAAILDGENLWVRALETGILRPEPWTIKIISEVPVDEYIKSRGGGR